jgi:hypothetical protein
MCVLSEIHLFHCPWMHHHLVFMHVTDIWNIHHRTSLVHCTYKLYFINLIYIAQIPGEAPGERFYVWISLWSFPVAYGQTALQILCHICIAGAAHTMARHSIRNQFSSGWPPCIRWVPMPVLELSSSLGPPEDTIFFFFLFWAPMKQYPSKHSSSGPLAVQPKISAAHLSGPLKICMPFLQWSDGGLANRCRTVCGQPVVRPRWSSGGQPSTIFTNQPMWHSFWLQTYKLAPFTCHYYCKIYYCY